MLPGEIDGELLGERTGRESGIDVERGPVAEGDGPGGVVAAVLPPLEGGDELVEEGFASGGEGAHRGKDGGGGPQAVVFEPFRGVTEPAEPFRGFLFRLHAEGASPAASHPGSEVVLRRHDVGVAQTLFLAVAREAGAYLADPFKEGIGPADGSGPALIRGPLAEEEQLAGKDGGLGHLVVEEDGDLGRGLVGSENALGPVQADRIGQRFPVGEVLEAEGGDEGVEVAVGDERKAAKEEDAVLCGFPVESSGLRPGPGAGVREGSAPGIVLVYQWKRLVVEDLAVGSGGGGGIHGVRCVYLFGADGVRLRPLRANGAFRALTDGRARERRRFWPAKSGLSSRSPSRWWGSWMSWRGYWSKYFCGTYHGRWGRKIPQARKSGWS